MKTPNNPIKPAELWYQDPEDTNLWHGKHGMIINTSALDEREFYYTIIRVAHHPFYDSQLMTRGYA